MSSRYNTGRKVQPHPPFCYSKKPGRLDVLPYKDGPAIGPSPYVNISIQDYRGPTMQTFIISGRLKIDTCLDDWAGEITGTDGSKWNIHFELAEDTKLINLVASCPAPAWTGGLWRTQPGERYHGGKQLDTGWIPLDPPSGFMKVVATVRAFL